MEKKAGIFYTVGVGPGDPELMTLKAVRLLKRVTVVAAPQTAQGRTLALDIAAQAVDLSGKTVLALPLPMTRDEAVQSAAYQRAAQAVEAQLQQGRDVAFLNLGDPSLYGTGSQLARRLRAHGFCTARVAGVPSFCAAAAALDESIVEHDQPLHIVPAGGGPEEWESALALPGVKVLMKAGRQLPQAAGLLRRRGLAEKTALAANCGLPGERLCHALPQTDELADAGYFVTLIVKE